MYKRDRKHGHDADLSLTMPHREHSDLVPQSPTLVPSPLKLPRRMTATVDDKFEELAEGFRIVPEYNEVSDPYCMPQYPIEAREQLNHQINRQFSVDKTKSSLPSNHRPPPHGDYGGGRYGYPQQFSSADRHGDAGRVLQRQSYMTVDEDSMDTELKLKQSLGEKSVNSVADSYQSCQTAGSRDNSYHSDDRRIDEETLLDVEDDQSHLIPHFQRITISGDTDKCIPTDAMPAHPEKLVQAALLSLSPEDLVIASKSLVKALLIREKYMRLALQSFHKPTRRFLQSLETEGYLHSATDNEMKRKSLEDHPVHPPRRDGDPFDCEFQDSMNVQCEMVNGLMHVYRTTEQGQKRALVDFPYIDRTMFLKDQNILLAFISEGPLKSFCYRRLSYLSSKFQLHSLLNELRESAAQKEVPHRDFYNVRKVDTHVHASSCMSQKHLLRFIKKKKVPTATLR